MTNKKSSPTQEFVPVKEIRNGILILKDGSMRILLIISSLNFGLKSAEEKMAIIEAYRNFLNSLDFSLQIFVQSRRLDIKPYIKTLEARLVDQNNDLLKIQIKEYEIWKGRISHGKADNQQTFLNLLPGLTEWFPK